MSVGRAGATPISARAGPRSRAASRRSVPVLLATLCASAALPRPAADDDLESQLGLADLPA